MRPAIYWMDWAALAMLLLLWPLMIFAASVIPSEFRFATAVAAFPLLLIETIRVIRFAGYVDEYTFREWFDHDLGIIGYRALYRLMYAVQFFFTRPTIVGALCFYALLGVSAYGVFLMLVALDGLMTVGALLLVLGAFVLMIWPLIVRRERQSWPEI